MLPAQTGGIGPLRFGRRSATAHETDPVTISFGRFEIQGSGGSCHFFMKGLQRVTHAGSTRRQAIGASVGECYRPVQPRNSRVLMTDPFNLQRFVEAQANTYEGALGEIQRGAKRGHWMWFIFPQIAGLGRSPIALRYAIGSLEEARAYLDHAILGSRLRECVETLQDLPTNDAGGVFGPVDAMKLRSSLTLFAHAGGGLIFDAAISRWFASADPETLRLINAN